MISHTRRVSLDEVEEELGGSLGIPGSRTSERVSLTPSDKFVFVKPNETYDPFAQSNQYAKEEEPSSSRRLSSAYPISQIPTAESDEIQATATEVVEDLSNVTEILDSIDFDEDGGGSFFDMLRPQAARNGEVVSFNFFSNRTKFKLTKMFILSICKG